MQSGSAGSRRQSVQLLMRAFRAWGRQPTPLVTRTIYTEPAPPIPVAYQIQSFATQQLPPFMDVGSATSGRRCARLPACPYRALTAAWARQRWTCARAVING